MKKIILASFVIALIVSLHFGLSYLDRKDRQNRPVVEVNFWIGCVQKEEAQQIAEDAIREAGWPVENGKYFGGVLFVKESRELVLYIVCQGELVNSSPIDGSAKWPEGADCHEVINKAKQDLVKNLKNSRREFQDQGWL